MADEDEEKLPAKRVMPEGARWVKGQSGNPNGHAGGPKNRLQRLFQENVEDEETAQLIWMEYFRLCLHARSEELRSKMLMDLLDRLGAPRVSAADGPTALAQVVNIIRNSPDLGV